MKKPKHIWLIHASNEEWDHYFSSYHYAKKEAIKNIKILRKQALRLWPDHKTKYRILKFQEVVK